MSEIQDGEMFPKRHGQPRDLTGLSAGSPFEDDFTYTAFAPSGGFASRDDRRQPGLRDPIIHPHPDHPVRMVPWGAGEPVTDGLLPPVPRRPVVVRGPNAKQRRAARNGWFERSQES